LCSYFCSDTKWIDTATEKRNQNNKSRFESAVGTFMGPMSTIHRLNDVNDVHSQNPEADL